MTPAILEEGRSPGLGATDLIVVAAMNILWGFNIIAVKMAVTAISPMTAGFLRQLLVLLLCLGSLRIVPGRMRELTVLGMLSGGIFYVATNLSLAITHNVGALAIAGQLSVPFSLLLAILVFRERIRLPRIAGILLSLAGVGLLVFDPTMVNEIPGLALTALASFIWAICSLIQRRLIGVPVLTIYAWIGFWGTIMLGAIGLVAEPDAMRAIPQVPLGTFGWIVFSAVGSTVLGQGAMSWLLQRHPVSTVTPLTLATPVIAVFATGWYFDTPPTMLMLTGGAIAMIGVAIVTIRTARAGDTP